jgi:hypothetical protein
MRGMADVDRLPSNSLWSSRFGISIGAVLTLLLGGLGLMAGTSWIEAGGVLCVLGVAFPIFAYYPEIRRVPLAIRADDELNALPRETSVF